jgi:protocatechuate 3,4-dioxygenase beta subunit
MRHLLLVVGLVWPIGFASAQTFGEITGGKVRDQSGATASNAAVTATNADTSASRSITTNGAGVYSFPSLVPGSYQVRVELRGFQAGVRPAPIYGCTDGARGFHAHCRVLRASHRGGRHRPVARG